MNDSFTDGVPRHLERGEGRVAYDVDGQGPLVVLAPGMGDLRAGYRFLAPALRRAGYRVATTDLRGHGASDATFRSYGDADTAGDLIALIEELGGPAVLVGNSMAAGSAVIAAADRPESVAALVLIGPFVRDPKLGWTRQASLRLALARPWAAAMWRAYLPKLYAGAVPPDFAAYRDHVSAAMRRPGYTKAFCLTARTSHGQAQSVLDQVSAPALVVMGERDPDFPDPRAEARWVADSLRGRYVLIPDAGHYPQSQRPDLTGAAIVDFLSTALARG